jgi:hypothetical protein
MLLCGCGGQEDASAPSGAREPSGPPAILECVPAGSTFYVSKSLSEDLGQIEKFLIDVGLGDTLEFAPGHPGYGLPRDGSMIARLKGMLRLGEGFDPSGASAAVFVNPKAAGIDFRKLLDAARTRAEADGGAGRYGIDYGREVRLKDLQAYVLCGKLEKMFVGREATKQGGVTVLGGSSPVEAYVAQKGPYVIYCRSRAGLNAILNAKRTVADELSSDEIAIINDSDITIHFAIESFRPIVSEFMDIAAGFAEEDLDEPLATVAGLLVKMARGFVGQFDSATVGVKLGPDGLNIDSICTAKPGSLAARVFQAESKNAGGVKLLDSLPSLPYVAAIGIEGWLDNPDLGKSLGDIAKDVFGVESAGSDESTASSVQMVLGAAPEGNGVLCAAWVDKGPGAKKRSATAPADAALTNKILAGLKMPPEWPRLSMIYSKGVESIGVLPIDSATFVISNVREGDKKDITFLTNQVMGPSGLSFLTVTPNDKTRVTTFGGSTAGLRAALKVADGTGPIPSDRQVIQAMGHLPENPSIVAILSPSNLMDVIRRGMRALDARAESVVRVPVIQSKAPIAFGLQAKGATIRTALHAPKPLIKDIVRAIEMTITPRPIEPRSPAANEPKIGVPQK